MELSLVINNNYLSDNLNIGLETPNKSINFKRKSDLEPCDSPSKMSKKEDSNVVPTTSPTPSTAFNTVPETKPHHSPKKRIDVTTNAEPKNKFIYGNYSRYYGYRNTNELHDVRLDVFREHKDLFAGKEILDIGCNSGFVTMEIAKTMGVKHITGIDIDKGLVKKTIKSLSKEKKASTSGSREEFPFNVSFVHGNYVLRDDVLLEIEKPQFDLVLCLSVTKWIHLNFGDSALKQAFRRMYAQLREGGKLILEPQSWDGYKRRKKLTPEIFENYKSIVFRPKDFTDYLLSTEVGFKTVTLLAEPQHCVKGFRRPIQIFSK